MAYQFEIPYEDGIVSDHAIASGSVPINYDYSKLMANKLTVDNQGNKKIENAERCFWDGGIASNTPLRELIQAHKDYWLDVKGKGKDDERFQIWMCISLMYGLQSKIIYQSPPANRL